jgi:hypothetical protein
MAVLLIKTSVLLINDMHNDQSAANPAVQLRNPMNLFSENSFHGKDETTHNEEGCPPSLPFSVTP